MQNAAAIGCGVLIALVILVAGTRYQRYLHLNWVDFSTVVAGT